MSMASPTLRSSSTTVPLAQLEQLADFHRALAQHRRDGDRHVEHRLQIHGRALGRRFHAAVAGQQRRAGESGRRHRGRDRADRHCRCRTWSYPFTSLTEERGAMIRAFSAASMAATLRSAPPPRHSMRQSAPHGSAGRRSGGRGRHSLLHGRYRSGGARSGRRSSGAARRVRRGSPIAWCMASRSATSTSPCGQGGNGGGRQLAGGGQGDGGGFGAHAFNLGADWSGAARTAMVRAEMVRSIASALRAAALLRLRRGPWP